MFQENGVKRRRTMSNSSPPLNNLNELDGEGAGGGSGGGGGGGSGSSGGALGGAGASCSSSGGGIRMEENPKHGMKVLQGLSKLQREKVLCDVTLIAEGRSVFVFLTKCYYKQYLRIMFSRYHMYLQLTYKCL